MLKNEPKQLSLYSILYNKIPDNHILKSINNAIDFSFINTKSLCDKWGRSFFVTFFHYRALFSNNELFSKKSLQKVSSFNFVFV